MSEVESKVPLNMRLLIPVKEPNKAYVSNQLWLPKEGNVLGGVRVEPIQKALEFTVGRAQEVGVIRLWEESRNHIICPREFLPTSQYPKYRFPFVDLRPKFGDRYFQDLVEPRDEAQQRAWEALAANDNGILNLGCGKGKTKLSMKKIAQMGVPTLVIVPEGGILDQWKKSIFGDERTPRGLRFDGGLGIVQGTTMDWKRPLTLALVTTLALKIRDGKLPEEFFRYFGLIIYDEVHMIGAPVFSQTAWPFYGDRIGLTATVQREDGLDPIYRYHIGEPFYSDIKQDLVPLVYFQKTPVTLDTRSTIRNNMTNLGLVRSMLGVDLVANTYRYWAIKEALDQGRKILCLSHSKNQIRLMHALFPGSGLITAETPREDRLEILRSSQVCFAIAKLGTMGLDDDRLDTLFWLTPFRSLIALQQSIGRVQRSLPGKRQPVVVVFEDWLVPVLKNLCRRLKSTFRQWKFNFEVLNTGRFPRELTPDLRGIYEQRLRQLPQRDDIEDDE